MLAYVWHCFRETTSCAPGSLHPKRQNLDKWKPEVRGHDEVCCTCVQVICLSYNAWTYDKYGEREGQKKQKKHMHIEVYPQKRGIICCLPKRSCKIHDRTDCSFTSFGSCKHRATIPCKCQWMSWVFGDIIWRFCFGSKQTRWRPFCILNPPLALVLRIRKHSV